MSEVHRISLKNVIQIDQIENLLSSLVTQAEKQEKQILHLQKFCETFVSQSAFADAFNKVDNKLNEIAIKVNLVEDAATSKIGNEIKLPAGELSFLNSVQIEKISKVLETLATSTTVNHSLEVLSQRFHNELSQLRDSTTPIDMTIQLNQITADINTRLKAVDISITNKIDYSEIGQLQTLVSRLEMYEHFKLQIIQEMDLMKQQLYSHDDDIKKNKQFIEIIEIDKQEIEKELKKCAHKTETRNIAKELEHQGNLLRQCTNMTEFQQLHAQVNTSQRELDKLHQQLSLLSTDRDLIYHQLSDKINTTAMREYVLRTHYDDVTTALGNAIDGKCDLKNYHTLQQRVQSLSAQQTKDEEQLSVAVHFVEWFTSRGEMYEHNMRIIDQHLGKLSSASHPETAATAAHIARQPYQHNVTTTTHSYSTRNTGGVGYVIEQSDTRVIAAEGGRSHASSNSDDDDEEEGRFSSSDMRSPANAASMYNNRATALLQPPIQPYSATISNAAATASGITNSIKTDAVTARTSKVNTKEKLYQQQQQQSSSSKSSQKLISSHSTASSRAQQSQSSRRVSVTRGSERGRQFQQQSSSSAPTYDGYADLTDTDNSFVDAEGSGGHNNNNNSSSRSHTSQNNYNNTSGNNNNNSNRVLDDIDIVTVDDVMEHDLMIDDPSYFYYS